MHHIAPFYVVVGMLLLFFVFALAALENNRRDVRGLVIALSTIACIIVPIVLPAAVIPVLIAVGIAVIILLLLEHYVPHFWDDNAQMNNRNGESRKQDPSRRS